VVVTGNMKGDRATSFVDVVVGTVYGGHTVISSAKRGTPDARTYTVDGFALDVTIPNNDYNLRVVAIGGMD